MTQATEQHPLDSLLEWAHRFHAEASEQPSFYGEMVMRVAYANSRLTVIEKKTEQTEKPTK